MADLKKITQEELDNKVKLHQKWLKSKEANGERLVLIAYDLEEANLEEANLTGAYLTGAYLGLANLTGADLTDANLAKANLTDEIKTRVAKGNV